MKLKINEWQELSVQKDIEHIKKHLIDNNKTSSLVNIDLILALLTFTIDAFLSISDSPCMKIARSIIVGIFASITIVLLIITACVYFKGISRARKVIKQNKIDTQKYVENFDNKVCYNAMAALSYMETYREIINTQQTTQNTQMNNEADDKDEDNAYNSLQQFCLIECDYYIYKCIKSLYEMKQNISSIVGVELNDILVNKKIDYLRIINIVRILMDVRSFLKRNGYSSGLLSESDGNAKKFLSALRDYTASAKAQEEFGYNWDYEVES